MNAKPIKLLFYLLFIVNFGSSLVQAQVHTRRFGQPQNFDSLGVLGNGLNIPTLSLNAIPTASLLAEDEQNVGKGVPFRFGINRDADIDIMNTANNSVKDGFTVFEYRIDAEKALSLNLIFDRFRLKEGAKMFLYNSDRTMLIGPITAAQNPDSGDFWTDIIQGSSLIIEVQEPLIGNGSSELHISSIIHGYHNVFPNQTKAFGDAGSCHPNMICYPDYQVQGDGVAMILTAAGSRICTGSMINNMRQSFRSYFLTANHCIGDGFENWLFRFNYQSSTCTPGVDDLDVVTLNGATFRSSYANSDFALLELTQQVPPEVNTTYNGWNRAAATTSNNFGIHHPRGDLKKISFTNADTQLVGYNGSPIGTHLTAFWGALGNTDPGSSGSPLFDGNRRIVGQLHGGPAFCGATGNSLEDYYGRFYTSWTGGGANNNRLSNWLDPDNSSAETTDGVKPTVSGSDFLISAGTFSLNTLNSSVVSWSVQDGDGLVSPTSGTGNSANLTVIGNGSAVKITFSVNDGQSYPIQFTKLFDTALPATASSNSAICEGGKLNLIGTGNGTFQWSGPLGFSSTNQNPSITNIQPTASGHYKLTVTNVAAGYTSVDSTLVTVIPASTTISSNLSSGFTTIQATQTISATNKIIDPAKVVYKAGNSVMLGQGFEANKGSTFLAQIGGCENVAIPGLVAYYPFNGNANDESTNNNNGIVNGATLTTDRFGNPDKAYSFDGINDRINANVGAEMYSAEKTISVWAAISGAGGQYNPRLVGVGPAGSSLQYYSLIIEGNSSPRRIQFFTQGAVADGYSTTLVPNGSGWQHYTVTYDGTKVKMFINGILDSETNTTGALANFSNALLQIGYSDNGFDWFNGKLDDIRIYNRALTNAEVLQLYNEEKPTTETIDLASGLVAYYPFNGSADDEAGNNDGIVNGATLSVDRYGNSGKAYNFDGNDYIEIPNATSLNLNYTTLSFWVNAKSSTEVVSYLITKGWDFEQNYGIYVNNGNKGIEMQGRVGGNWLGAYSPPNTLTLNQWNHVTGVFDGNKFTIYINGLKSTENAATGLLTVNNQNLFLGRNSTINSGSAYWLNGSLDDVRIYNRALSEAEIQAIYNAEKP